MARYWTRWGWVFHSTSCRDDWSNIVERDRDGYTLKLQSSAMRSYRAAEGALGREIALTGSWRSCERQAALYASDPTRYAHPAKTLHTQGLAIDVSTAIAGQDRIREVLTARGWKQSRPDDEPWHYSFYLKA